MKQENTTYPTSTRVVLEDADDALSLKDLWAMCWARKFWFVLSLTLSLGLATLYLLITPPVYKRTATLLIKDDSKGKGLSLNDQFSFGDMGLLQSNTNVHNELASLQSPTLILEAIKRLELDVEYYAEGRFYDEIIYGRDLPARVRFLDLEDAQVASLTLYLDGQGGCRLSEFALKGEPIAHAPISGRVSDTLESPLGRLVVVRSELYQAANQDKKAKAAKLYVKHLSLYDVQEAYATALKAAINNDKASVIDLTYQDRSIQRAEDFLSMLINVYNESWVKDKNQVAVSTSLFINERLSVIERELGHVDKDISAFKSANLIPDLKETTRIYLDQTSETEAQLLDLSNQLYMARYIRQHLGTDTRSTQLIPAISGIGNKLIDQQIGEYNQKMLERNSLRANSSDENPIVQDLTSQIEAMRSIILSSLDNQVLTLDKQVASLKAHSGQATARISANPTQAEYLISVERQQKIKEALYLFLLQKREENELSQAFSAYNTRIITPPTGKMLPIAPMRRNILLAALVIGLLLPIGLIYLSESMNTLLRSRRDLEGLTIPFVGELPTLEPNKTGLRGWLGRLLPSRDKRGKKDIRLVVETNNRDMINEAFRLVRTNMEFMFRREGNGRAIAITSINTDSGKTFVTLNLAASFAAKGHRVLMIDADMRVATLSGFSSGSDGLSAHLTGHVADYHKLIKPTQVEHLYLLPVGALPPNPTELLAAQDFVEMLQSLRQEYDYIFVDCPPVDIVADAALVSKYVDMTMFVVRAGLLDKSFLPVLERYYREARYPNMALLLNGTEIDNRYGRAYGYGYGYGHQTYGEHKKKK